MVSRRTFLRGSLGAAVTGVVADAATQAAKAVTGRRIDREALVARHKVVRTASDPLLPLQVGNGQLAFGTDITGLQTFIAFNTLSHWGWHSDPVPAGQDPADYQGTAWDVHGRQVYFWTSDPAHPQLHNWLRQNPHRINLGRIGLRLLRADGTEAVEADLTEARQELDLWTGVLTSTFKLDGEWVTVTTSAHSDLDVIGVEVESTLVRSGRAALYVDFPHGRGQQQFAPFIGIFNEPNAHVTELQPRGNNQAFIRHTMGETVYGTTVSWRGADDVLVRAEVSPHRYVLAGTSSRLGATFHFTEGGEPPRHTVRTAGLVARDSARGWSDFWNSGGVIDLSESTDPRWEELERRVVQSQYLMAVNSAGDWPPQESALVNNGWWGKFHLEMIWWHSAHYALWNRWPEFGSSPDVYERFLPQAKELAARQGFRGARWPKMTAPNGVESPGLQNTLLIWQHPHPMFFAELDHRAHPGRTTLEKWKEVIFETADFLASFAFFDEARQRYVLGPPIVVVSENTTPAVTVNPTFELSYWRFGLRIAQQWRQRLGMPPNAEWDAVLENLAPLPVEDGRYVTYEGIPNMWTQFNFEHPALIGAYGWLPGDGVDVDVMHATNEAVTEQWDFSRCWGWDFPMLAMNAARLGKPEQAVDYLFHELFTFHDQGMAEAIRVQPPYFPANGGLLYAVAMMAAGWDGAPDRNAPGFPEGWNVRSEGLSPAI